MDSSLSELMAKVDINSSGTTAQQSFNETLKTLSPMEMSVVIHRHEAQMDRNNSWEGIKTRNDKKKSQQFIDTLRFRGAVICPYCRSQEMSKTDTYLVCNSCNIRFETHLSIHQIVERMNEIIAFHSSTNCNDPFVQLSMFQSNLTIFCDTCPLYQYIL